jgi:hypothetical protein
MIKHLGGEFDPAWVSSFSWEAWSKQPYFSDLNKKDQQEALKTVYELAKPPQTQKKEE